MRDRCLFGCKPCKLWGSLLGDTIGKPSMRWCAHLLFLKFQTNREKKLLNVELFLSLELNFFIMINDFFTIGFCKNFESKPTLT